MKKKYFIGLLFIVAICIALFMACKERVVDVSLNKDALMLVPEEKETLIAIVHPTDASNDKVTWTSSNRHIVTVNTDGLVTAIAHGDAIITVNTNDGNKTATCAINVDYRNNWIGVRKFTTISEIREYCDFGWDFRYDTVFFTGSIEKYYENRLKIIFKANATEPDFGQIPNITYFPLKINGLIYPIVDCLGVMNYPEYSKIPGDFSGHFSTNEIYISYNQSAGHTGFESHRIHGIKPNKKENYEKDINIYTPDKFLWGNGSNATN